MEKWSSTLFVAMLFAHSRGVNDVFVTEETCGQESVYCLNSNWIGYFDKNTLLLSVPSSTCTLMHRSECRDGKLNCRGHEKGGCKNRSQPFFMKEASFEKDKNDLYLFLFSPSTVVRMRGTDGFLQLPHGQARNRRIRVSKNLRDAGHGMCEWRFSRAW